MALSSVEISRLLDEGWFADPTRRVARGIAAALIEFVVVELPEGGALDAGAVSRFLSDERVLWALFRETEFARHHGATGGAGAAMLALLARPLNRELMRESAASAGFPAGVTRFFAEWCPTGE